MLTSDLKEVISGRKAAFNNCKIGVLNSVEDVPEVSEVILKEAEPVLEVSKAKVELLQETQEITQTPKEVEVINDNMNDNLAIEDAVLEGESFFVKKEIAVPNNVEALSETESKEESIAANDSVKSYQDRMKGGYFKKRRR